MQTKYDTIIIGSGVSGLYCALNLDSNNKILLISKTSLTENDSHLAQGGICVLKDDNDYDDFFNDTLKAGHFENDKAAVREMILNSQDVINDLIKYDVDFEKDEKGLKYTKEGAHTRARILFHKDITGKEITSKLLNEAKRRSYIDLVENAEMLDIITKDNICYGAIIKINNEVYNIYSKNVVLACGGVGGLYENSTNYPILTADALVVAYKNNVELKDVNYVQIHPTTLYQKEKGRRFLISESVRGEGALLYDKNHERFTLETQARDVVTNEIKKVMVKENSKHVFLDMRVLGEKEIKNHFPNIYQKCLEINIDPLVDLVPVVPAQHYYMGGIKVNLDSKTSMEHLYAVGECACNGVHGKNRLASNSLLESLVFAKKAAQSINKSNYNILEIPYKLELDKLEEARKLVNLYVKGEKSYEFFKSR